MSTAVLLDRYRTRSEASIVSGLLTSHGIINALHSEHHADVDWFLVPGLGGVGVAVPAELIPVARDIVRDAVMNGRSTLNEFAPTPDAYPLKQKRDHDLKLLLAFDLSFLVIIGGLIFLACWGMFELLGTAATSEALSAIEDFNRRLAPSTETREDQAVVFVITIVLLMVIAMAAGWRARHASEPHTEPQEKEMA